MTLLPFTAFVIASTCTALLAPPAAAEPRRAVRAEADSDAPAEPDFKRVTFDVGGSSNFSNGSSAYEAHLGVNVFLMRWLAWRNSPFYRSQSGVSAEYGLDSSIDGHYSVKVAEGVEPNVMLGGGYRFINAGSLAAPFVEGALGAHVNGIGVSVGIKQIFHTVMDSTLTNETQYSVGFSGGLNL